MSLHIAAAVFWRNGGVINPNEAWMIRSLPASDCVSSGIGCNCNAALAPAARCRTPPLVRA
eukprot:217452-Pyramimonas_sp.AAC.1